MAVEHKKLLMKEFEESGKNKEQLEKISGDIEKLQEILKKLDDKHKQKEQALADLEQGRK